MHTFFRHKLPLGLFSTLLLAQTVTPVLAQQGDGQGNRPVRLTPAQAKRPAEPRRLNSSIVPATNPNLGPRSYAVPVGVQDQRSNQAAPIPATGMNRTPVQQMAGPQSTGQQTTGQKSEIQQQLDEMYRQKGLKAPTMNHQSLPQVQAAQAEEAEEEGDEQDAAPQQPNGQQQQNSPQQRMGTPSTRQLPNTPIRGTQPGQGGQNPNEAAYKEPNLLKRWFGPRKKPEQPQTQRPQQYPPQGQGMPRAPMSQQTQQQQNGRMNQAPVNQTPPEAPNAQMFNPQVQAAQPATQPVQQPVQQQPAQPGRAMLESGNPQRGQGQPAVSARPRPPAAPVQSQVVVPVQPPAQPTQPNNEEAAAPQKNAAAPQEEDIPRLSDEPVQEEPQAAKTTEAPKTPASPEKKSPFENLEIYTPEEPKTAAKPETVEEPKGTEEPKSAAPGTESGVKDPAATEAAAPAATTETAAPKTDVPTEKQASPEQSPAHIKPLATPPGKTSMQDLQTRPQAVLFLDGEDDEQREKYRMLAAFPEKSGFKGFCPTALRDERDLVRGRKNYQLTHRNHVYLFSSAKALATAQANPEKYFPAADGQDVVLMKEAENVEGSLDSAAWYRGRLYLFASRRNLELFAGNPGLYVGGETTIPMPQHKSKAASKVTEQPAEVSDDDEEEEMEESGEAKESTPARNQSPASILNGPTAAPKAKGSENPVPPPPSSEESDEPEMPGKKIKAAKFSDKNSETIRTRTIIRVSVPAK